MSEARATSSNPPKGRKNRSVVHEEFIQLEVIDAESNKKVKKSQCKHCAPDSRYRVLSGVNPTNLRDHLKAHHPEQFARVKGI